MRVITTQDTSIEDAECIARKARKAEYDKKWRLNNPEKVREQSKSWKLNNPEKVSEKSKKWRLNNPEKVKAYRLNNQKKISESSKKWRLNNQEKVRETGKMWKLNNPEKVKESSRRERSAPGFKEKTSEYKKQWKRDNPDKVTESRLREHSARKSPGFRDKACEYEKKRHRADPLPQRLRSRVRAAMKRYGTIKSKRTIELVGCSIEELRTHLSSKFTEGMTWDLFSSGAIHIDYIIPVSSFDLTDPEQQKKCFGFQNLQPLWARDNLVKGSKIGWGSNVNTN